eukprot:scaffold267_cov192-Amphora_coffeaeformis.AAC.12
MSPSSRKVRVPIHSYHPNKTNSKPYIDSFILLYNFKPFGCFPLEGHISDEYNSLVWKSSTANFGNERGIRAGNIAAQRHRTCRATRPGTCVIDAHGTAGDTVRIIHAIKTNRSSVQWIEVGWTTYIIATQRVVAYAVAAIKVARQSSDNVIYKDCRTGGEVFHHAAKRAESARTRAVISTWVSVGTKTACSAINAASCCVPRTNAALDTTTTRRTTFGPIVSGSSDYFINFVAQGVLRCSAKTRLYANAVHTILIIVALTRGRALFALANITFTLPSIP